MTDYLIAFFAPISFGVVFNVRLKSFFYCGLVGLIAWSLYQYTFNHTNSPFIATFFGSTAVGISSELLARLFKVPALSFSVPGVIPLVPGVSAYKTANFVIEDNLSMAAKQAIITLGVAGSIAVGIVFSTLIFRTITDIKSRKTS